MRANLQISAHYQAPRSGAAPSSRAMRWRHAGQRLEIEHGLDADTISDSAMIAGLVGLIDDGALAGQEQFESAAVAVIESVPDDDPWTCFYRNSLAELTDGSSPFAAVHRRARAEIVGERVLEVGSCFGFLALACARDGRTVNTCDISPGAVTKLRTASRSLGIPLTAGVGDARRLPYPDDAVDTVTLIHLLEHLDGAGITAALREALRVARRRVVVAVPFETEPSPHFGHLHSLGEVDLARWAASVDHAGARIDVDHGGWLILTPVAAESPAAQINPRLLAV